jgi:hypothetical protein
MAVGLDRGQDLQRPVPVPVERVDALVKGPRAVDEERRPPSAARVGAQDRPRGAHGELEARVGSLADDRSRVGVEEHRGLVARRVLQLFHHQPAALRGGRPVDAPERLALLVLAHAVEVEARRAAQQEPAALRRARPCIGEEPVHVDQTGVDEDRGGSWELDRDALEAERVLDHDLGFLDRVAPARDAPKHVAPAQAPVTAHERRLPLPEAGDALPEDHRSRGGGPLRVDLDLNRDVVAGEPLSPAEQAPNGHRALEEPDPEGRGDDCEHEPQGDGVEHLGAERPGGEVDPASEGEYPAAAVREHRRARP